MTNHENKVAVITGAASGIGKAIATHCLKRGMNVVLADSNEKKLYELSKSLKLISDKFIYEVVDVGIEEDVMKLALNTFEQYGKVNYLFNNAGIAGSLSQIWNQSTCDIERVLRVNLMGTIFGVKYFIPKMLEQTEEAFIINTSAGAGLLTGSGLSTYKASKHAVIALSEVIFADLKQMNANINVSVLIPHLVNTEMPLSIISDDSECIKNHLELLKKNGMSPELVADIVFDGLNEKRFYIFTHADEHLPRIKKRMEGILALKEPC